MYRKKITPVIYAQAMMGEFSNAVTIFIRYLLPQSDTHVLIYPPYIDKCRYLR